MATGPSLTLIQDFLLKLQLPVFKPTTPPRTRQTVNIRNTKQNKTIGPGHRVERNQAEEHIYLYLCLGECIISDIPHLPGGIARRTQLSRPSYRENEFHLYDRPSADFKLEVWMLYRTSRLSGTGAYRGLRSRSTPSNPAELTTRYSAIASVTTNKNVQTTSYLIYRETLAKTGCEGIKHHGEHAADPLARLRSPQHAEGTAAESRGLSGLWGDRGCGGCNHLRQRKSVRKGWICFVVEENVHDRVQYQAGGMDGNE